MRNFKFNDTYDWTLRFGPFKFTGQSKSIGWLIPVGILLLFIGLAVIGALIVSIIFAIHSGVIDGWTVQTVIWLVASVLGLGIFLSGSK